MLQWGKKQINIFTVLHGIFATERLNTQDEYGRGIIKGTVQADEPYHLKCFGVSIVESVCWYGTTASNVEAKRDRKYHRLHTDFRRVILLK